MMISKILWGFGGEAPGNISYLKAYFSKVILLTAKGGGGSKQISLSRTILLYSGGRDTYSLDNVSYEHETYFSQRK